MIVQHYAIRYLAEDMCYGTLFKKPHNEDGDDINSSKGISSGHFCFDASHAQKLGRLSAASFGDYFRNEAVRVEGDDATCKHIRSDDKGI